MAGRRRPRRLRNATIAAGHARSGHGTAPAPTSLDRPPTRPVQRTAELGGSSRCGPVIDWTASAGALPGGPPWLLTTTNVRVAQSLHRPRGLETHDAFVAQLRARHGRETGFWGQVT